MLSIEEKKRAIVQHFIAQKILPPIDVVQKFGDSSSVDKLYSEISANPGISPVRVISTYAKPPKKIVPQDFVDYYNARYRQLSKILGQRQELQNLTSIGRLGKKEDRDRISVIGMILKKDETKNGNYILTIEDPTGTIKAIASKSKPAFGAVSELVEDEVVGIVGTTGNNAIFIESVVLPDVPLAQELKKTADEVYAVALSCIHVGSTQFLRSEFRKFTSWLRGEVGSSEQRRVASLVKYVFIVGDIVEGVGIHPTQQKQLLIEDITEQYAEAARLLAEIPQDKFLVMCPGNHDAMRLGEPQYAFYKDIAKPLYDLPNATLLSNPSMVNVHGSADFPGFNVLLYHGFSFIYYADNVECLKVGTSVSDRVAGVMKFLLEARHLAPTHGSSQIIPDNEIDPMIIDPIPDIFIGGHIHKAAVTTHRGVILVAASCFQSKTDYQEKFGVEPDPGRVPLINLQTREVKMLRFDQ